MNEMTDEGSPEYLRWLHEAIKAAFPDKATTPESLPPCDNFQDVWRQLTNALQISDDALADAVANNYGFETADLAAAKPFACRLVPEATARKYLALPLSEHGNQLVVAVSNPFDKEALEQIQAVSARTVILQIAPPEAIDNTITANYSRALRQQTERLVNLDEERGPSDEAANSSHESAATRLGLRLLRIAIERRASDIHVQPFAGGGVIRCRVDGVLQRIATLPTAVFHSLVRQFKAVSGMDPSSDRTPQDGQLATTYQGREIELRISTLPCRGGERLVMRLHELGETTTLEQLEFPPSELAAMLRLIQQTAGIFLITGPTGSGKTTTLYALLERLNHTGVNIITIENPVEQEITGISQVEVNETAGLTFASALRSILRQDPDIVLVGEIRDAETADIAVQAALTGHLVLSTLHTNDALTAVPRLLDLDVPSALIADSVIGVSAQRLLRRACPECKQPPGDTADPASQLFTEVTGIPVGAITIGCEKCDFTGYSGRLPIAEIIEIGDSLREALVAGHNDLASLREATRNHGRTLSAVAADWIISGVTTADEASRVLGGRFWRELCEVHDHPVTTLPPLATTMQERNAAHPDILLVEPNDTQENALRQILDSIGLDIVTASGIDAALEILHRESTIRLLLLDIDIPGTEPKALLRQLRTSLTWAGLPFVLLLRENDTATGELLDGYGVSDYLYKPFTPEHLQERIKAVLAR